MTAYSKRAPQAAALVAALVVGGVVGWLLHGSAPSPRSAAPTPTPGASGRPMAKPVVDGHLTFTVLTFGCGLTAVQGTHAEGEPEGQFCDIRLRVDNHDPAFHDYVTRQQTLAGVTGPPARPDPFAMAVRRQPDRIRIGGHNAVEVELWYDVPKVAHVTGVRLSGDRDPVGFRGEGVVPHKPGGVLVRLLPTDETPG
ncbi:MAG: hypothetical protein J2P14_13585 [Acidothermales bacterium]|nr:hypothetical protein [Acidothermales bacterium]